MLPRFDTIEVQVGKLGRPFRLTGIIMGEQEKWIKGELKHDWYYVFMYDDDGTLFTFHEDVTGKFFEKLSHRQTMDKFYV